MKKLLILLTALTLVLQMKPNPVNAQDEATPKKYENVSWKTVVYVDYRPGKQQRAMEIISDYFAKASVNAGTPQPETVIDMSTGGWDLIIIWNMKDGVESLNWEVSPDDIVWRKALNEIAGSADKAQEILDEYSSLVARGTSNIGLVR